MALTDTHPENRVDQQIAAVKYIARMIVQLDSTDASEAEIDEFCLDLRIDDPRILNA
ncbi:MAG: hypothetical protein GY906_10135 [bacterium]|nr:hypothetical protein [bacterium]